MAADMLKTYRIKIKIDKQMDIKNILTLLQVKKIGPAFVKKNLIRVKSDYSCMKIVQEVNSDEINKLEQYAKVSDEIIKDCKLYDIDIISIFDSDYPQKLKEISDPPSVLYVKGNHSLLHNMIAVIGTRHSSNLGNKIAERVGLYFSNRFAICNGLVEGIDEHSIYHDDKILNNVVGVISGGLCYKETCSAAHVKVIDDVLKAGGLIISEYAPKQKENMFSGSKASRIQAGLSKALILVQSKVDGGSKYTLKVFSKLGRPIGIIHFPTSEEYNSEVFGANRLIVEKKIEGLAKMLEINKASSLGVGNIIPLANKADYDILINEIVSTESNQQLWQKL